MNKRERMYQKITEHGERLKKIFALPEDTDPVKLCKSLLTLERAMNRHATDYCNGTMEQAEYKILSTKIFNRTVKILGGFANAIVFINSDPRGYSLKIYDSVMRRNGYTLYRDMGGYGIIAPDFSEVQ